jgi:predicted DNA-binding protein YlxM (UPF0122 family)
VSKELETRNRAMYSLYIKGVSIQQIADRYDVTRQRVSQVISKYSMDITGTEDESRALHYAQLEAVKDDLVGMYFEPLPPRYDVKGNMLIDENGEPVRDTDGKLNTVRELVRVSESMRKMDALDKPRRKQLPQDEAMRQMQEYLASLPKAEVVHDAD